MSKNTKDRTRRNKEELLDEITREKSTINPMYVRNQEEYGSGGVADVHGGPVGEPDTILDDHDRPDHDR